jgi:hypothetical protein
VHNFNNGSLAVLSTDAIREFSDEELRQKLSELKVKLETSSHKPKSFLEVEYCYVQRELLIREFRKKKHHTYAFPQPYHKKRHYERRP